MYEVHATDSDEGVNGEVRYAFLQTGAGNRDWENFHIDAMSGVITTTVKLDREKQALHSVSQLCVWAVCAVNELRCRGMCGSN